MTKPIWNRIPITSRSPVEVLVHTGMVFTLNRIQGHCPQAQADSLYEEFVKTVSGFEREVEHGSN